MKVKTYTAKDVKEGKVKYDPMFNVNCGYGTFVFHNMSSNCKFFSIDCVNTVSGRKENFDIIKHIVNRAPGFMFNINTNSKAVLDRFKENFTLVGVLEIPIGYGQADQLHAFFLKSPTAAGGYLNRIKKWQMENPWVQGVTSAGKTPKDFKQPLTSKQIAQKFTMKDIIKVVETIPEKSITGFKLLRTERGKANRVAKLLANGENL